MKKKIRKIRLNKETLRNLQSDELRQAEGGAEYSFTCKTVCCDTTYYTQTCQAWNCA